MLKNVKGKIDEIIKVVKEWIKEPKNNRWIKTGVFALMMFYWCYVMTGYALVGLTWLVASVVVFVAKEFLTEKKKALFWLVFVAVAVLSFFASYQIGTTFTALLATGTWLFSYLTFRRAKSATEWTVGALMPTAIVFYAEFLQQNLRYAFLAFFRCQDANRVVFVVSLFVVMLVSTFFIKIFNSKKIGYYISLGLFALISNINLFELAITGQPLTFSDIHAAAAAFGVINTQSVDITHWIRFAVGLVVLALFCVVIAVVYKRKEEKKKLLPWLGSVAGMCVMMVLALVVSRSLYSTVLLYNGHLKHGFIGNFYITIDEKIDIPDDVYKYIIDDRNDKGDYKPNVIIIMNEAFSDLGETFDLSVTEDPLEYFHSLQKEYPSGISYSSVRGNNTCSSEWELLSGSPTALTAKGSMIYQTNDKPMRSIVSLFNSRGYTTVGFHPYKGLGYNRKNMYASLGFDKSVFLEDMPSGLDTVREYVTDEENYKYLISLYEENEAAGDDPFFCFNITMQNHGGYVDKLLDDVRVLGDKEYPNVDTYLSVIDRSDEALKMLISYFESVEEDTVILFFGDHQPMIDTSFYDDVFGKSFSDLTIEELQDVYAVPYLIWANYELNEEAAPEETSICYLSNILFEVGGLPKSTWINMTDEYRKVLPVITVNFIKEADGDVKSKETIMKSPGSSKDVLELYQNYSCGILYGLN